MAVSGVGGGELMTIATHDGWTLLLQDKNIWSETDEKRFETRYFSMRVVVYATLRESVYRGHPFLNSLEWPAEKRMRLIQPEMVRMPVMMRVSVFKKRASRATSNTETNTKVDNAILK